MNLQLEAMLLDKTEVVADINLNDIYYELHTIAKNEALKGKTDIELINFGISEVKKTFVGACDCVVTVSKTEKAIPDFIANYNKNIEAFKEECYLILKTYILFFIGEKQANEFNKDQLLSIELTHEGETTESYKVDYKKSLLDNLFEATESSEAPEAPEGTDPETPDKTNTEALNYVIGYSIKYACDYEGVKRTPLLKILKFAESVNKNDHPIVSMIAKGAVKLVGKGIKSLFNAITNNAVTRDLSKLSIGTFGGNKIEVGKAAADAAKGVAGAVKGAASAVAKTAQNIAKLAGLQFGKQDFIKIINLFKKELDKKYVKNDITVEPLDSDVIITQLKLQGKYDSTIKHKFENSHIEYVIGIEVNKSDKYYLKYNEENFAKIYNSAVDNSSNFWTKLHIKYNKEKPLKSDILKISDFKPKYEVKQDNIKDKHDESIEFKANNLMRMIFENFHDYVTLTEADDETVNNFKRLFIKDTTIDDDNKQKIIKKLENDSSFDESKATIKAFKTKDAIIQELKNINTETELDKFISHYTSGLIDKLKYMLSKFNTYVSKTNKVDSIVNKFVVNGKLLKTKIQHIAMMFKKDTELTDDYFEVSGKIKDKNQFCKMLTDCKDVDQLHALFDNYNGSNATLKLFDDKINEYFRKNKLQNDDKVDLYIIFKKHIFPLNTDAERKTEDTKK